MNKLWKLLLAIGGIIGGILLVSNKKKSTYKKDLEDNKAKLKEVFSKEIEIKKIVTTGDENQKDRLSNLGGKGLFSKKIEDELLENIFNSNSQSSASF